MASAPENRNIEPTASVASVPPAAPAREANSAPAEPTFVAAPPVSSSDSSAVTAPRADTGFAAPSNPHTLTHEIRDADASRLKVVLAQTRAELDINAHALTQLRQIARKKAPRDRTEFDAASIQMRMLEVALRTSIAAAATASPADAAEAQAQVARDYEAYARAVAVAEAAAQKFHGTAQLAVSE